MCASGSSTPSTARRNQRSTQHRREYIFEPLDVASPTIFVCARVIIATWGAESRLRRLTVAGGSTNSIFCLETAMIKELAEIDIRPGDEPAFEKAAIQARDLFLGSKGCIAFRAASLDGAAEPLSAVRRMGNDRGSYGRVPQQRGVPDPGGGCAVPSSSVPRGSSILTIIVEGRSDDGEDKIAGAATAR